MKTPIRGFVRFGFGTWGRGACWAGAAIILLAAVGWGQEPTFNFGESPVSAKGYVNNLFQVDQFDNINLFNGNLMLNIPIGPKYTVGPNLSYQLKLVYNSKIWAFRHYYNCRVWCEMEPVGQCEIASIPDIICTPACDTCGVFAMRNTETNKELIGAFLKDYPSSGVGWTLHMGRIMSVKDLDKVYESPDGARHRIAEYQGDTGPDLSGYSYTNDGSYLRFNKPDTGPWEMWDAAGNHYIFGFSVDPDSPPDSTAAPHPDHSRNHDANHDKLLTYYLTEIDDPYGHWVKIAYQRVCKDTWEDGEIKRYYDALPTVMWDTTGRTITFNNQPEGEYWVTKAISIPNVSGQSSTYVLSYDAKAIFRARNDTVADASYCDDYPDSCDYFNDERRRFLPGVPLLASIALPVDIPNADSSTQTPLKYQFEYAQRDNYPYLIAPPDPSTEGYDYAQEPYELSGTLRKVVFPTGGQVQYLYKDRLQMTSSLGGGRSCENKYCQYLLEKSYFNNKFPPLAVATKTIQQSSQTWQYIERLLEDSDCEFIKWVNGIPYTRNYRYMVLDVVPPDDPFDKDGGYYRRHYFYMGYDDVLFGFTRKMETRRKSDNAVLVEQVHVPDWDHEQDDPGIIIVEGTPGSTNERNFCDLAVSTRYEDVDYNIRIQETRTTYSKSGRTSETTRSYSTDWDHFGHYEKEYHCESSSCTAPVLVETDFTPDAAAWILNKFNSVKKSMDPAVDKNILTAYVFDPLGRITDSCTFEDYINQAVTGCDMLWDLKRHYSYNTEGFLAGIDHLRMISGDSQLEYSEQVAYTCGIPAVKQFVGAPFKSLDRTIDCYTGLITAERDSAGIQTSLQYDALGRVLKILPSNGEAQTWVNYIDPNHTKVETRDGGELVHASDYYFDQLGRKTVTVRDNWSTGTGDQNYKSVMQVTSYSPQGKVFHTSEWLKATCDAATCPHLQAVTGDPPDPSNTSLKGTLNLDFDEQSRFTLQYRPNPSALRGYDDTTIIYDGITHKTVIESDVSGSTVDTDYTYDLLGRLIGVDDFLGGSAGYEYDHQDRLRKVTQWGDGATQERTFAYDDLGRLTRETHPEQLNQPIRYTSYDALGNLLSKTDANGTAWSYGYDPAGRLLTVRRKTSQETAEALYQDFAYDGLPAPAHCGTTPHPELGRACGKLVQTTQYYPRPDTPAAGHLNLRHQYRYFGLNGRLSKHTLFSNFLGDPDGTGAYLRLTWGYEYNTQGLLYRLYYPLPHLDTEVFPPDTLAPPEFDNRAVYTYKMGQAHTLKRQRKSGNTWVTADIVTGTSYFPGGLPEVVEFNHGAVEDRIAIDPATMQNRPQQITFHGQDGTTLLWDSGEYRYDGVGNITNIGSDSFHYDPLSRLDLAFVTPHDGGNPQSRNYRYDTFGNLLKNGPHMLDVWDDGVFPANRLPSTLSDGTTAFAAYDTAGNLKALGQHQYHYEASNRMVEYKHMKPDGAIDAHEDYWYDTEGERLLTCSRADGGAQPYDKPTLYIRDEQGNVLGEFGMPATNSFCPEEPLAESAIPQPTVVPTLEWKKDYYYFNGRLVATERFDHDAEQCRKWAFYHSDHLGTPRMITDENGNASRFHTYWPFGEEITAQGQDDLTHKYTGHERDFESNLDYMHARYYNNFLGRFLSVDTLNGKPDLPKSWNRYSYTLGNPISLFDPDGEAAATFWVGYTNDISKTKAVFPNDSKHWRKEIPSYNKIQNDLADAIMPFTSLVTGVEYQSDENSTFANLQSSLSRQGDVTAVAAHTLSNDNQRIGVISTFNNQRMPLAGVPNNNAVVIGAGCYSTQLAGKLGITDKTVGQAYVGFEGKVDSNIASRYAAALVAELSKGKSVADAVAYVNGQKTFENAQATVVGDESVVLQ